jgi:RNA polymerase sigma-70 factor, ECF subfamily
MSQSSLPLTKDATEPLAAAGMPSKESPPLSTPNWIDLVAKVKAGDPAGLEQLYKEFYRGLRYILTRQLGPHDVDDTIHDIFLAVVKAIQDGGLRESERLMGFVRTVAQRQVAAQIKIRVNSRHREVEMPPTMDFASLDRNPETQTLIHEKANVVRHALTQLSGPQREILERFYLLEQSSEQICSEMNLTETQFRLHKTRAKSRFGEIGKKWLGAAWNRTAPQESRRVA